jgi:hypothetical protein
MPSSKITKDAFNAIQSKIAAILGAPDQTIADLGYNLGSGSSQVQTGSIVYGDDVNKAIGDLNTIVQHQTGFPTNLSTFSPGQIIGIDDLTRFSSITSSAYTSRTTVGPNLLAVTTSDAYSNGDTWRTSRQHTVTLDWGSNANFRGWSNAGGLLTVSASFTGGSGTAQTGAWSTLLSSVGTIVLSGDAAVQINQLRAGSFLNGGLYNIIQNGQGVGHDGIMFRIISSETHYTSNAYTLVVNPYPLGKGVFDCTGFTLTATMTDPHTAPTNTTDDYIDSLFSWTVNTYFAYSVQVPVVVGTANSIT